MVWSDDYAGNSVVDIFVNILLSGLLCYLLLLTVLDWCWFNCGCWVVFVLTLLYDFGLAGFKDFVEYLWWFIVRLCLIWFV